MTIPELVVYGMRVEVECACGDWGGPFCDCSGIRWRFWRVRRGVTCRGPWRPMTLYWDIKSEWEARR